MLVFGSTVEEAIRKLKRVLFQRMKAHIKFILVEKWISWFIW